ncbi:MAG: hypothetical protein ABIR56_05705 [Polaromonas sp.]
MNLRALPFPQPLRESAELVKASGKSLQEPFYEALHQPGTAVVFTGMTMLLVAGAWAFSDLKFQADMGILLVFMFLMNMPGAVFLLPAMACWLGVGEKRQTA